MPSDLFATVSYPTQFDPNRKYPVIFAIHGRGSDEQDMLQALTTIKEDCVILAIRGPHPQGNGYSFFPIIRFGSPEIDAFNAVVESLASFIREADDRYPIDPTQKYLFGFSQGAILSMTLALKMGHQIRGLVALNGYIPQHIRDATTHLPVDQVDLYIMHGTEDQIFPIQIGRDNAQFFTEAGGRLTYGEFVVAHDISFEEQAAYTNWFRQRFHE
jgi:phospholipase/carboxylesterase